MIKQIKKAAILPLLILILVVGLHHGCGRKAPPKPPSKDKPSTVNRELGSLRSQLEQWHAGMMAEWCWGIGVMDSFSGRTLLVGKINNREFPFNINIPIFQCSINDV